MFLACVSAGHGGIADTSLSQLPIDERPIVTRELAQGRTGASPDERYGDGSSYGGADGVQGSPPKAPPRILHSGEGSRPHESRERKTAAISFPRVVATLRSFTSEPKRSIKGLESSTRIRLVSRHRFHSVYGLFWRFFCCSERRSSCRVNSYEMLHLRRQRGALSERGLGRWRWHKRKGRRVPCWRTPLGGSC